MRRKVLFINIVVSLILILIVIMFFEEKRVKLSDELTEEVNGLEQWVSNNTIASFKDNTRNLAYIDYKSPSEIPHNYKIKIQSKDSINKGNVYFNDSEPLFEKATISIKNDEFVLTHRKLELFIINKSYEDDYNIYSLIDHIKHYTDPNDRNDLQNEKIDFNKFINIFDFSNEYYEFKLMKINRKEITNDNKYFLENTKYNRIYNQETSGYYLLNYKTYVKSFKKNGYLKDVGKYLVLLSFIQLLVNILVRVIKK